MIISKSHDINIRSANFILGFEKFIFKNTGEKSIKSLALSMDSEFLNLGSLDSSKLEFVQFAYLVIQESIRCQTGQIMVFDELAHDLKC